MRVVVSGATGLIGTALVEELSTRGHQPSRLVRRAGPTSPDDIVWDPAAGTIDSAGLAGADAIVHLAGEGIASRRWTATQKAKILDSRVRGTGLLAETVATMDTPPSVFLSGSAIGFYGDRGDDRLDEASPIGAGFVAEVATAWEGSTAPLDATPVRVAHLRTGVVLSAHGGALAEQLPIFRFGLGGRIGSGRQWFSWISIHDQIAAILWLLEHPLSGPVNLTSPNPVTNAEFVRTLGRVLRRPTLLPTPRPAIWAKFGRELTAALLEASAHVAPRVLLESGFEFAEPDLEPALRSILARPARA